MDAVRLIKAVEFTELWHRDQKRKYTGEPYIVHPLEVAGLVAEVGASDDAVIAALFHDLVEDTGVTLQLIGGAFGPRVAQLVHEVTDVSRKEHGNRAARKALDMAHLANASPEGQTIKLADLISNTRSIAQNDPDFSKVYFYEKEALLCVLTKGDPRLMARAKAQVWTSISTKENA